MKRLVLCCDGTWNSADEAHNKIPELQKHIRQILEYDSLFDDLVKVEVEASF